MLSKCTGTNCPVKANCHNFIAIPNEYPKFNAPCVVEDGELKHCAKFQEINLDNFNRR